MTRQTSRTKTSFWCRQNSILQFHQKFFPGFFCCFGLLHKLFFNGWASDERKFSFFFRSVPDDCRKYIRRRLQFYAQFEQSNSLSNQSELYTHFFVDVMATCLSSIHKHLQDGYTACLQIAFQTTKQHEHARCCLKKKPST